MTYISERLSPIERLVLGKDLVDTLATNGIKGALKHVSDVEQKAQNILELDAQTFPFPQLSLIRQALSRSILEAQTTADVKQDK